MREKIALPKSHTKVASFRRCLIQSKQFLNWWFDWFPSIESLRKIATSYITHLQNTSNRLDAYRMFTSVQTGEGKLQGSWNQVSIWIKKDYKVVTEGLYMKSLVVYGNERPVRIPEFTIECDHYISIWSPGPGISTRSRYFPPQFYTLYIMRLYDMKSSAKFLKNVSWPKWKQ